VPKVLESVRIQTEGGKELFRASPLRMNTDGSHSQTKEELRRWMRTQLRAASPEQRAAWSAQIVRRLKEDDSWVPAAGGVVAMFGGMASEPDLLPMLPWLAERGVRAAFFAIGGGVMVPHLVRDTTDLRTGQMGVLEPDAALCGRTTVQELDAVLLPGVAFSRRDGLRLGRGKGHYDRALAGLPGHSPCVGVCFQMQVLDDVPGEAHDRPVQALVTEQGWLKLP
jgi:5-formyltetrahydrofolate cyclo-ligase